MDANKTEVHSFVQFDINEFGIADDEDDYKPSRVKPIQEQQYNAKENVEGWFHGEATVPELLTRKLGASQLKSAIEHHYLCKRYNEAYDLSKQWIQFVEAGHPDCKLSNAREMREVAAHCAMKLGHYDEAADWMKGTGDTAEPGLYILKGEVYTNANQYKDAIQALKRYNEMRRLDYNSWRLLGITFANMATGSQIKSICSPITLLPPIHPFALHYAHLCLHYSHHLMTVRRWSKLEQVQRRYRKELHRINAIVQAIQSAGGDYTKALTDHEQLSRSNANLRASKLVKEGIDVDWDTLDALVSESFMDVTRENFEELLPSIKEAIHKADFIAIDTELTGVNRPGERLVSSDDAQTRYTKSCATANDFLVIQYGICTFSWSETDQAFVAVPYNFYVFPNGRPDEAGNRVFLCSSSSLAFLSRHGFDFNKCIISGIPYLNHSEEERLLDRRKNMTPIPVTDENRSFLEATRIAIDEWLQRAGNERLQIATENKYYQRLVHEEVANECYNDFLESRSLGNGKVEITKLTEEQRQQKLGGTMLVMPVNFRIIMDLVSKASKRGAPVIAHNAMLDLCQTFAKFYRDLPPTVAEFKTLVHETWPSFIDTKHMAAVAPELRPYMPNTGLGNVYDATLLEAIYHCAPKIGRCTRYNEPDDGDNSAHEAAFDAYITGAAYLRMAEFILTGPALKPVDTSKSSTPYTTNGRHDLDDPDSSEPPSSPPLPSVSPITTDPSKRYTSSTALIYLYNKVFLMNSELRYLDLIGIDEPRETTNEKINTQFYLIHVDPSIQNTALHHLFKDLGPIRIEWKNHRVAQMTLKHHAHAASVHLGPLGTAKIAPYMTGGKYEYKAHELGITWDAARIEVLDPQGYAEWQSARQRALESARAPDPRSLSSERPIVDGIPQGDGGVSGLLSSVPNKRAAESPSPRSTKKRQRT
ncbi:hypothetical protein BZG36_02220 [Bifiguratus adelaidae]|uniref:Uncharacterized protein n=1 Tax=Bifiguratus adelaidae TaxID=1938954 RepID=A0A261Y3J2_9FUNG|nr:hypothetical protein BZG36_02220 [Bifiguratus adelaidae]